MKPDYSKATFLLGAAALSQLPPDTGIEVAFAGRSNAGKSSVLNQLTHNRQLARVSKTPGRTQQLNVFMLDEIRRLVDLPGYGYAKVPPAVAGAWQKLLGDYFETRHSLKGCMLIMDSRHPLKPFDCDLLEWAHHADLPVHILLNKSDKLSQQAARRTLADVTAQLNAWGGNTTIQLFSALKGTGLPDLKRQLDAWLLSNEDLPGK